MNAPRLRAQVKFCGLRDLATLSAAAGMGARYVGFVFYPPSPRAISVDQAARLAAQAPMGLCKVGLFVNPDDALLDAVADAVALDMIQLHGQETPERAMAIRTRLGLPIMKAVGVASADDLTKLSLWEGVADQLLCDAKPPKDGTSLPGGNGLAFDWRLVAGRRWARPWMLAGGLTPANVADAVSLTGAPMVDVSSGVESAPGQKDVTLMQHFCAALS